MKILWIVNMVLPKIAKHLELNTSASGGWLIDLLDGISAEEDVHMSVMTYYGGKDFKDITLDGVRYFLFPGGGKDCFTTIKKQEKTVNGC